MNFYKPVVNLTFLIRSLNITNMYLRLVRPEPEFLNILKCNLAESATAGFQLNCHDIFNDKTLGALFYSLTLENTALCEKSTFQP
jgi:hypothetical protein